MATIRRRGKSWFAQIRRKGFTPKYKSFSSKSDALLWARSEETAIDNGYGYQPSQGSTKITLRDILQKYREEVTVKKKGYESENLRLQRIQTEPICDLLAVDLTPAAFSSYRNERLQKVKPGTVKRELGLLRHTLEIAKKEWGVPIRNNPIDGIAFPKVQDARQRRLNEGEAEQIEVALNATKNHLIGPVVYFAIETAMRRGEILNLKWTDVCIEKRSARIRNAKNGCERTIPLTKKAVHILRYLPANGELVFPITGDAIRQSWKRLCHRSGIADLRFHDLRHEAISRFCEMGLSIPEVALISGHKDPRMLFRYTHLLPAQVNARIDQLTSELDEPNINRN